MYFPALFLFLIGFIHDSVTAVLLLFRCILRDPADVQRRGASLYLYNLKRIYIFLLVIIYIYLRYLASTYSLVPEFRLYVLSTLWYKTLD